jgi:hypothetical protein
MERALRERAGVERYQLYQRAVRSGTRVGARPREFDENGFPVPQRSPNFIERVGRLLNPL